MFDTYWGYTLNDTNVFLEKLGKKIPINTVAFKVYNPIPIVDKLHEYLVGISQTLSINIFGMLIILTHT